MLKKILILLGVLTIGSSVYAINQVVPGLSDNYVSNFSQKGLFMVTNEANSIWTNIIKPNVSKPYWWDLENTWWVAGMNKKQSFLDIWINFNINTRKLYLIDGNGYLATSNFSSSRHIDYKWTEILSKAVRNKLTFSPDNTVVGYRCWTDVDDTKNVTCMGLTNLAGFFKVTPYAIDWWADGILPISLTKVSTNLKGIWFVGWSVADLTNYKEYWILFKVHTNGELVYFKWADERNISQNVEMTYIPSDPLYRLSWVWMITTSWNNTNSLIWYYWQNVIGLFKVTPDPVKWLITTTDLLDSTVNGYVWVYPRESVYTKDGRNYMTVIDNWQFVLLDYTDARIIKPQIQYPLLNKAVLVDGIENTVKTLNMATVLWQLKNGFTSNTNSKYVFAKPFWIMDPQFVTIKNADGINVNYISSLGVRNLNTDKNLNIVYDTNKTNLWIQAWVVYWASWKDNSNTVRIWKYRVGDIWYHIWYVDNGKIIYTQIDWTGGLEKIYSPLYAIRTNLNPWNIKWFIQNLNNTYIFSYWTLKKYMPYGNFENKTLTLRLIAANDNPGVFVNLNQWTLDKFDETDERYINYLATTKTPDVLSWVDMKYITPTNTRWGDLYIAKLSGDKLYLNTYIPDTQTLLSSWDQFTSESDTLTYFKTDNSTSVVIDADWIFWVK